VLHIALANGHIEVAQFVAGIIDHRARDGRGNTRLAATVGGGRIGAIYFVLGLDDVDPNPTNGKRQTIIRIATGQQSPDVPSRVLKANGIRMRQSWGFMTMNCFALETEFGDVDVTDTAIMDRTGPTVLYYAIERDHLDLVRTVIDHGRPINQTDNSGRMSL
jgi:ankyrin repeat protein